MNDPSVEAPRKPGPLRLLVLVSGGGTNLQALLDAQKAGKLGGAGPDGKCRAVVAGVVADKADAYALERAKAAGVPAVLELPRRDLPKPERRRELSDRILGRAAEFRADLIVLAGFLSIVQGKLVDAYAGRMVNLHPALLPKFGGEGMWGHHVHEAVLAAGEAESGCTVHFVDSGTDTGPVILRKRVPVLPGDTPDSLAERIHAQEHAAMVEAVELLASRA